MTRTVVLLLAAALLLAPVRAQETQKPIRVSTRTVAMYATVTDAERRLVPDLVEDDFEIYDNGKLQPISVFSNDIQPITIVVMLDRSGSMEPHYQRVQDAATAFVANLLPGDRTRIGSFSNRIQIDPETFTSDKHEMLRILRERMQPMGPTPLWGAASAAMTALNGQPGRRVVLIFTDGRDAPLSDQPQTTFAEVKWRAETEEVMVYGIGLANDCAPASTPRVLFDQRGRSGQGRGGQGRGGPVGGRIRLPPTPLPLPLPPTRIPRRPPAMPDPKTADDGGCRGEGPDPSLRTLADVGGGGYFELHRAVDLSATFTRVATELHQQYLLAFVSPARDGVLHGLEVRVRKPGLTVRARRGYMAPK